MFNIIKVIITLFGIGIKKEGFSLTVKQKNIKTCPYFIVFMTFLPTITVYAVFYAENELSLRIRSFLDYLLEHINLGENGKKS